MQQRAPQNKTLVQNLIEGTIYCTTGALDIVSGVFSYCQNKIAEKITSLVRWHYNLNQEREELRLLRETLEKRSENHKKAESELQHTVDRKVKEKLDSMRDTISKLEKDITALKKEKETLSTCKYELQSKQLRLTNDLEQETLDLNDLKNEKSILKESISDLENQKSNLEAAIEKLKEIIDMLHTEIESLNKKNRPTNQTYYSYNHSYEHEQDTYSPPLFSSETNPDILGLPSNSAPLLLTNRQSYSRNN